MAIQRTEILLVTDRYAFWKNTKTSTLKWYFIAGEINELNKWIQMAIFQQAIDGSIYIDQKQQAGKEVHWNKRCWCQPSLEHISSVSVFHCTVYSYYPQLSWIYSLISLVSAPFPCWKNQDLLFTSLVAMVFPDFEWEKIEHRSIHSLIPTSLAESVAWFCGFSLAYPHTIQAA